MNFKKFFMLNEFIEHLTEQEKKEILNYFRTICTKGGIEIIKEPEFYKQDGFLFVTVALVDKVEEDVEKFTKLDIEKVFDVPFFEQKTNNFYLTVPVLMDSDFFVKIK